MHSGDLKTTFCHLICGGYFFLCGSVAPQPPPPALHFWEPKILKNFIIFRMQDYHILFFSFLQAGFKYETRNDQIFTQVKLFDKNVLC